MWMKFAVRRLGGALVMTASLALIAGLSCPAGTPTTNSGPTGSCCAADGTCTETVQADCSTGTWTSGGVCSPSPCTPSVVPVTPQLFIANYTGNSVTSYTNPGTLIGNVPPNTNLAGASTGLSHPVAIAVTASGVLLAVNFSAAPSITSYSAATSASGNLAPTRNVQGSATGLAAPLTLAINTSSDVVFVANGISPYDINVYDGASTPGFNGNLPPARIISSPAFNQPFGINLGANDDLYVANAGGQNVLVFANASTRTGTIGPDRVLTSPLFTGLFDCFVDTQDRLYVVNGNGGGSEKNKVFVINNASTRNGAVDVDSVLSVTGAISLGAIAVDKHQTGYIVEGSGLGAIYVFDSIHTKNGSYPPDRTISGSNTQMNGPIRVFLVE